MEQDSIIYDSLPDRPLPKWLTDQRDGLNTYQPEMIEMKEDRSLGISFAVTGLIIIMTIAILIIYFSRKKNRS